MHFPHSVTIDGETYIHKERCEREQAERDVEYRKLERDWQHLGKRVLELQDEIAALRAGRTPYGQLHAELEQAKTALAEKDAEIATLQQRLHDAIETREVTITRVCADRDEARQRLVTIVGFLERRLGGMGTVSWEGTALVLTPKGNAEPLLWFTLA